LGYEKGTSSSCWVWVLYRHVAILYRDRRNCKHGFLPRTTGGPYAVPTGAPNSALRRIPARKTPFIDDDSALLHPVATITLG